MSRRAQTPDRLTNGPLAHRGLLPVLPHNQEDHLRRARQDDGARRRIRWARGPAVAGKTKPAGHAANLPDGQSWSSYTIGTSLFPVWHHQASVQVRLPDGANGTSAAASSS